MTVLAAALALAAAVQAHAAQLGRTTVGTLTSSGLTADFKRGSKFQLTEDGTITQLCAYLDGQGGTQDSSQLVRFALYRDAGGVPGAKLTETPFELEVSATQAARWYCQDVGWLPVTAGSYWIAIHSGANAGVVRYYYDGPANWYGNADTFADGASDPFGAGNPGNGTISAYATYTPASQLHNAGHTSIGATTSSGLRASFKRGSSFTLSEGGRLTRLSIYLDSLGGASGSQQFSLVLYRDENGVPGARVAQSWLGAMSSGLRGRWISLPADPVVLTPGRYWIAIASGTTAGVLRYYADGSGNWYGNAESNIGQASDPFGPGATGDGTISAFASYEPGNFTTKQFGRTDVGSQPSKGLTANFMRGSFFTIPDTDAALTGLNAYLDGNGGGSGTQQLRMAIYDGTASSGPGDLITFSDVVTILAGQAPGWVHFPVAAFPLTFSGYWVMIESGNTAGVARDYADGPANWAGLSEIFVQGPPNPAPEGATRGTVTISAYGTYTVPAN